MDIKGISYYVNPNTRTLTADIKKTAVSDRSMYSTFQAKLALFLNSSLRIRSPTSVFEKVV